VRVSGARQAGLSLYWFAFSVQWTLLLIVALPRQVLEIVGDAEKGRALGLVVAAGAVLGLVAPVVVGALSDRTSSRFGARAPYMAAGLLVNLVGLAWLALARDLPNLVLAYSVVGLGSALTAGPYAAVLPDCVPAAQRGSASGWIGLMSMLGNFVGGMLGYLYEPLGTAASYAIVGVLLVVGVGGSVAAIGPPARPSLPPFSWRQLFAALRIDPVRAPDFFWVFMTRFLTMMGIFTVQEFLQYYQRDVVGEYTVLGQRVASGPDGAVALFVLAVLIGAIASTLWTGQLSDRSGRKGVVVVSGVAMAIATAAFVAVDRYDVGLLIAVGFGLGYGAFQAVDWALAADVLPSSQDSARDLGIWHAATILPSVVAVPIGGALIDALAGQRLAYQIIFALAAAYFLAGAFLVRRVRGVR
jgi:MFS family permease